MRFDSQAYSDEQIPSSLPMCTQKHQVVPNQVVPIQEETINVLSDNEPTQEMLDPSQLVSQPNVPISVELELEKVGDILKESMNVGNVPDKVDCICGSSKVIF
jgi:hypothetical protein